MNAENPRRPKDDSPNPGRVSASFPVESGTRRSPVPRGSTTDATMTDFRATLPTASECRGLLAGLVFLDGTLSGTWRASDLADWFGEHLVERRLMKRPRVILEPRLPPLLLDPRAETTKEDVDHLISRARSRVLDAVRGFAGATAHDGFLNAAIFSSRVQRRKVDNIPRWVPLPHESDFLSDIVLSLMAADVLMDREYYRSHISVCEVCERVALEAHPDRVGRCFQHRGS